MEEFKAGSIFIAALFGLSGFLVIHIVATYCFVHFRLAGRAILQIIFSVLLSSFLLHLYSLEYVYEGLLHISHYSGLSIKPTDITPEISRQIYQSIFIGPDKNSSSLVIRILLFELTAFSCVFGLLLSLFINSIKWLSSRDLSEIVATPIIFLFRIVFRIGNIFRDIFSWFFYKKLLHLIQKSPIKNIVKILELPTLILFVLLMVPLTLVLIVLIVILMVIFCVFTLIAWLFYEALAWIIFIFLKLFQHPLTSLFEGQRFSKRSEILVVEVLTSDRILNKGKYVSSDANASGGIRTITISNVIQYAQGKDKVFFNREDRKVFVFPDSNSTLTLNYEDVINFNVRHINLDDDSWKLDLDSHESIENQIWYLSLLLSKKKNIFSLENFEAYIDVSYSMEFFEKYLVLLMKTYSSWYQLDLLREKIKEYRKYHNEYSLRVKKKLREMPDGANKELLAKSRKNLIHRLVEARKK